MTLGIIAAHAGRYVDRPACTRYTAGVPEARRRAGCAEGQGSVESGEIEITSLRSGARHPQHRRPASTWRRLLVTCGCALALLLAVTGLLLATQPNPRTTLDTLLGIPSPTATAPLALGTSIFFVAHRVPWGVLTIDSTRNDIADIDIVASLPNDPLDGSPDFLLDRGRHQVVYNAPPFAPLRCVVTVPAAARDTCPLATPDETQSQRYIVGAARILDLGATLANLPAQSLADLKTAAAAAISLSTPTILARAGEHYLGTDSQTHTFAQDAQATLFRAPWTGTPVFGQTDCHFLCPSTQDGSGGITAWNVGAQVRQGYHYTAAAPGGAVPDDTPLACTPASSNQPYCPILDQVELAVTWAGRWQVSLAATPQQSLTCQAASELLSIWMYGAVGGGAYSPPMQPVPPVAAANPVEGCVAGVQIQQPSGTVTIELLYRFGVLLTLDAAGSAAFPYLPSADAPEQALAQQILAHKA